MKTQNQKISSSVETVTPEMASALLARNGNNRILHKGLVATYKRSILSGDWQLNGEAIIVFSNGDLGDGQHRLSAVVAADVPVDFLVTRGVDKSTFSTIDGGRKRTCSDILGMAGEINSTKLAAAARVHFAYCQPSAASNGVTPADLQKGLAEYPAIRYWVNKTTKVTSKGFSTSLAAFLAIAATIHGNELISEFLEQLEHGVGLCKGDPALVLREKILTRSTLRLTPRTRDAFMIKAINAHTSGRKLTFLRLLDDEEFPTIQ